mgnify:CR=1 FL=1
MGACTSKPKVLKGDVPEEKVKAPEPAPKEVVVEEEEKKDDAVEKAAAVVVEEEVKKDEDVAAAAGDEKVTRSRSLGNLFKEVCFHENYNVNAAI